MHLSTAFAEDRLEVKHGLIRAYPLGMLIIPGAAPTADLVPFALYPDEGEAGLGVLRAHIARGNPASRALAAAGECLVVFQGPETYISPSWYASKAATHKAVPTWNYAMVQVRGKARVIEDAGWLQRQVRGLTAQHEAGLAQPWEVDDAPIDYIEKMLRAIVGIEIPIASINGKWKMNQNRSDADMASVVAGLRKEGSGPGAAEVAACVEARRQPVKPD